MRLENGVGLENGNEIGIREWDWRMEIGLKNGNRI